MKLYVDMENYDQAVMFEEIAIGAMFENAGEDNFPFWLKLAYRGLLEKEDAEKRGADYLGMVRLDEEEVRAVLDYMERKCQKLTEGFGLRTFSTLAAELYRCQENFEVEKTDEEAKNCGGSAVCDSGGNTDDNLQAAGI